jgi:tight adherence protein B
MRLGLACLLAACAVAAWPGPPRRRPAGDLGGRARSVLRRVRTRLRRRTLAAVPVAALCHELAAELEAGAPPELALRRAAAAADAVPRARAAAVLGEPVAPALAADAAAVGSTALAGLAACWRAAEQSGARLAAGLERVAATATAEEALAADLRTELAAPMATAKVLVLLPLAGLLLGELLGARPIAWLLGSPAGLCCAVLGLLLMVAARVWSGRIIAAALPDGVAAGTGRR